MPRSSPAPSLPASARRQRSLVSVRSARMPWRSATRVSSLMAPPASIRTRRAGDHPERPSPWQVLGKSLAVKVRTFQIRLFHRGGVGNKAASEYRLLLRSRWQLPCPGRRRPHFGIDMNVEEERLVGADRMFKRTAEILRFADR